MAQINKSHWARTGIGAALLACVLFAATGAFAKPSDSPPARWLDVPLVLDGRELGDVALEINVAAERRRVRAKELLFFTDPFLSPDQLNRIRSKVDSHGFLYLADLIALGMHAKFDHRRVVLEVAIPGDLRPLKQIGFRGRPPLIGPNGLAATATLSSLLNIRSSLDFVHQSVSSSNEGRQPLNLAFEWATNFKGVVLENDFRFQEDADHPWHRDSSRLVYDDVGRAVRYAAGDLFYPVAGFQTFRAMAGITVARNFDLQPYRVTEPGGQHEFVLKRESHVDVLINGRKIDTLRLPPGRYDFRDFPFSQGSNDVSLRIRDPAGKVTTVDLNFLFDSENLAKGLHEFAYSIGLPSSDDNGLKKYESGMPTVSAFHRYGATETLTVGANFQGDDDIQNIGAEAIYASAIGTFGFDVSASHNRGQGSGFAGRASYEFYQGNGSSRGNRSFAIATTYKSPNFTVLESGNFENQVMLDSVARYSHQLTRNISIGIGASYQIGRGSRDDTHNLDLTLRHRFMSGLTGELRLSQVRSVDQDTEYQAFLSFYLHLPQYRQFVQANHDTANKRSSLDWQYQPKHNIHEPYGNVTLIRDSDAYRAGGNLYLNDYRAEAAFSHDYALMRDDVPGSDRDQRSSLRLGTALVFADGHFALSRPVTDSFALVVPHENLKDKPLGVDPVDGAFLAKADSLGPAVRHDLSSYQIRAVTVSGPDLPLGYDLGQDVFQVSPRYRSGTVLRVGTDATVLLDGRLVNATGEPISLVAGDAEPVDMPESKTLSFFTNRKGRFRIDGVSPGSYILRLRRRPEALVRIDLPKDASGLYRAGDIVVPGRPTNGGE